MPKRIPKYVINVFFLFNNLHNIFINPKKVPKNKI